MASHSSGKASVLEKLLPVEIAYVSVECHLGSRRDVKLFWIYGKTVGRTLP